MEDKLQEHDICIIFSKEGYAVHAVGSLIQEIINSQLETHEKVIIKFNFYNDGIELMTMDVDTKKISK